MDQEDDDGGDEEDKDQEEEAKVALLVGHMQLTFNDLAEIYTID